MRKQVIFLVTAFVFIIIMCGSVSAAENTTGGGNDDDSNVIISGQVLDCVTNQPFANASVTATGNGEEMAQTFSDQQGNYELKFFSNLTQFNVTATYDGHKPSSQIVNTSEYLVNNTTIAYGNTNLSLGKPKAIFLFTSTSAISNALMNALEANPHFTSEVYLLKDMPANLNLTNYDLVFFDYLWTSSANLARVTPLIEEAKNANIPVIVTVTYYMTNPTNINLTQHPWIRQYWTSISPENAVNLLKYMAVNFLGATDTYKAPATLTKVGIYHPDTTQIFSNLDSYLSWYTRYDPTKPTVALMFGEAVYNKANTLAVNAIIQGLESRGYNVIPYFLDHETYALGKVDINTFLVANGTFLPDLVIHYRAAGWD
ncbi:MAG: cobaltochelatase subunit CobN, partial [Methanobacteriaceae archaeon]|nr:cobaltochelatase subunit CobN [Methanobacteriaceae archaeon]